ncbi:MerR family transcriptional regulator [Paenibacillus albiflavus]|uniref:MerR family transcriptional regulator n=1 Tax=Paenibacillus albiflavus TaxID=2545760 RepID=A0A4R4E2I0_9BACL|nr:MerR family transcriptional regulator [Paenibacillus albiflavus]TCZ69618.1 MerR family transcriptional regulator [Paenibacillus albiflavus]
MLSIKQFSERTGISPSALRFYETKGLLFPNSRLERGHRKYSQDQVSQARLIHSLRQAQISLSDIATFMKADPEERENMMMRWRHESEVKLLCVQVANQFLQGFNHEQNELHLVSFEKELFMIWYTVAVPDQGPLPFMEATLKQKQKLLSFGVKVLDYGFVRTLRVNESEIIGEIGFQIRSNDVRKIPKQSRGYTIREIPYALFATLEYKYGETYVCYRILSILRKFGFVPTGEHFDKYIAGNQESLMLYVPVAKKT